MAFRLPHDDEHMSIVGRNGTGKTQFGFWTIAARNNLRRRPTVVLDYKGDELINSIPNAREIGFNEVPQKPGLYILHSSPDHDDETEKFLHRLWQKENCGLFVDEGYMIPKGSKKFRAILTQGRAKKIPVTTLSQRPVGVDRFAFSESVHNVFFSLNDDRDLATIREYTPKEFIEWVPDGAEFRVDREGKRILPDFHARWYSVKSDERFVLKPCPSADEIIDAINRQIEPKTRML